MSHDPNSQSDSAPPVGPGSQQVIRWVIMAVIVGVLVFNWWSDRKAQPVVANKPEPVLSRELSDESKPSSSAKPSAPTGEVDLDVIPPTGRTPDEPSSKSQSPVAATDTTIPPATASSPPDSTSPARPPSTTKPDSQSARGPPPSASKTTASKSQPANSPSKPGQPRVDGLKVHDVVIRNLDDEVVFRGTVDLTQTLARIDDERTLKEFRHDGIEFKNFERRLPSKPKGHYREWVHPTRGLRGPGPQRVVTGKDGEAFYTWDHYEHFVKIRSGQ